MGSELTAVGEQRSRARQGEKLSWGTATPGPQPSSAKPSLVNTSKRTPVLGQWAQEEGGADERPSRERLAANPHGSWGISASFSQGKM